MAVTSEEKNTEGEAEEHGHPFLLSHMLGMIARALHLLGLQPAVERIPSPKSHSPSLDQLQ